MRETFGDRLKELMDRSGIKSDALGRAVSVSGQTVRAWRAGKQTITRTRLIALARYFGCTLDFLAGRSDDDTPRYIPRTPPPFYENLRAVMKECGVSWYRVTHYTAIKDSYFTGWSRGCDPRLDSLIALADYLDVTIDRLVGLEKL